MRSAGREFLRLCGVAIVVGGLAVVAVLALLMGLPMIAARGRQDDTPLSPGAAPSLSNSGNSGSTVWK